MVSVLSKIHWKDSLGKEKGLEKYFCPFREKLWATLNMYLGWFLSSYFKGGKNGKSRGKVKASKLIAADQWRNSLLWLAWQSTFFSKQMPCFCSLLSGVPALYRLLQGEVGHRCFISFNLWKWYHMCVSLFFWLVIQMFNLNMSHLIFLLLSSLPSTCAHTAWTDCPLGSYVGIDQVGQPCHWGVSKCACAWVSVQHSWSTFVYLL